MKSPTRSEIIGMAAVPTAAAVAVAVYAAGSTGFRQAFLPVVIATFLGVIAGLPVALWIDSQHAAARQQEAATEKHQRLDAFLGVMEADLRRASNELQRRVAGGNARTTDLLPFLQANLWEAVTASSELALVTDPELLRALADAYYAIATTAYFERQVWELRVGVLRSDPLTTPLGVMPPRPRLDLAEQELRRQDDATLRAIDTAVQRIAARREGVKPSL